VRSLHSHVSMIVSDEEYLSFLTECNLPSIPQLRALMLDA
jgi:hypothetical protein